MQAAVRMGYCRDATCDGFVQDNEPDSDITDRTPSDKKQVCKAPECSGMKRQKKIPMNSASYLFTTAASRLPTEPFAADGGLWLCCWSAAMALDTPCPYAGSALEQLAI